MNQMRSVLPSGMEKYQDDQFWAAHESLQDLTVADLLDMPPRQLVELSNGTIGSFYEFIPEGDVDESIDIVHILPFAHDMQPQWVMRVLAMQRLIGPHRVIVLPQNEGLLTKQQRQIVADGDFDPIAERRAELLSKVNLAGATALAGYSFGGSEVPPLAYFVNNKAIADVKAAVVAEAPNVMDRNLLQLGLDFTKHTDLGGVIQNTDIPALTEYWGVENRKMSATTARDMGRYLLNIFSHSENLSIWQGMTKPTLGNDLQRAIRHLKPNSKIVMMRDEASVISPDPEFSEICYNDVTPYARVLGVEVVRIVASSGFGHAIGDNPMLFAALVKESLSA